VARRSDSPSDRAQQGCGQVCRWRRNIEGYAQSWRAAENSALFQHRTPLEFKFVDAPGTRSTLYASQVFRLRKLQEVAVNFGATVDRTQSPAEIVDFRGRSPEMIDHEVPVAEPSVVRNEKCNGRVKMFEFVDCRRVDRDELVAVEGHTGVDPRGQRLCERGFPDTESAIQDQDLILRHDTFDFEASKTRRVPVLQNRENPCKDELARAGPRPVTEG
jgi:hypothetical protein